MPSDPPEPEVENKPYDFPPDATLFVTFIDHDDTRFVFPYENCRTWAEFRSLLDQVYTREKDESVKEDFNNDRFDILTQDDEVILPSLWSSVLRPDRVYHLTFWSRLDPSGSSSNDGSSELDDSSDEGASSVEKHSKANSHLNFERGARREGVHFPSQPPPPIPTRPLRSRSWSRERETAGHSLPRSRSGQSRSPTRLRSPSSAEHDEVDASSGYYGSGSEDSEDSEDSVTLTSDEEGESETPPPPKPIRGVVSIPTYKDEKLCFLVDTKWALKKGLNNPIASDGGSTKARNLGKMELETLRILKVLSVTADNGTALQIHTLPAPETPSTSSSIDIRWYHLSGEKLDFTQFKNVCLTVPGLSDRMRLLTTKMLGKIEKEKIKVFSDGMFIEPGTVLRADEGERPDESSENESVIFSCIPYFHIRPPLTATATDRLHLHPPLTLMQSRYPYENVRERDMEQAIRKLGSDASESKSKGGASARHDGDDDGDEKPRKKRIVHIPFMWSLNIGSRAVITCGIRPLDRDLVKSMTVVPEDVKMLGTKGSKSHGLPSVRLVDWTGRVLIYSTDECGTYFEMEQKLEELRHSVGSTLQYPGRWNLAWNRPEGDVKANPRNWPDVIKNRDSVFINLSVVDTKKAEELKDKLNEENSAPGTSASASQASEVPPFFSWPCKTESKTDEGTLQQLGSAPKELKRSMHCIELVEKAMLNEALDDRDTDHAIDRAFTSNKYYQSLPEKSLQHLRPIFISLLQTSVNIGKDLSTGNTHQLFVEKQISVMTEKAARLIDTLDETLKLFVLDTDKGTVLQKIWGAMANIAGFVDGAQKRGALRDGSVKPASFESVSAVTGKGDIAWSIRNTKSFDAIRKCKACRHDTSYPNREEALSHLRLHLQSLAEQDPLAESREPDLNNWIHSNAQALVEHTNSGYIVILALAEDIAHSNLAEAKELAEGVRDEDGKMSDLYKFPHELLKTLRGILVFYLAIERACHLIDNIFQQKIGSAENEKVSEEEDPRSRLGLDVLKRFGEDVKTSIYYARRALRRMTRLEFSASMFDVSRRLSFGPEYLCGWLMRRLLVKPVDGSLTVADMYREYLSMLSFQVNHRPSKRLLREINLLQEELIALQQVNSWQMKLIESYSRVLDDSTYQEDIPSRRSLYPYERLLLSSCLENLRDAREDFAEQIQSCGPLSDSTKQSAEINEEDHGKAIFVFTVVTVIFLPLSFVTSYLGMNTSDIRDMDNKQDLFWSIAIPLTTVTMGSVVLMAYNGDEVRDFLSSVYGSLTGKTDRNPGRGNISVAQRRQAAKLQSNSSSTLDYRSLADDAEFAVPFPAQWAPDTWLRSKPNPYGYEGPLEIREETIALPASHEPPGLRMAAPQSKMLKAMPQPAASLNPNVPTYFRMSRRHILPETLDYYGLPWEPDRTDPDYIVVTRELAPNETAVLFEHSRRLRDREGVRSGRRYSKRSPSPPHLHSRNYYDHNYYVGEEVAEPRREYNWMKSRNRTRARTRAMPRTRVVRRQ